MGILKHIALYIALTTVAACVQTSSDEPERSAGLYADIHTSRGVIKTRLFYNRVPLTVMNFLHLAEGGIEWTDPRSGEKRTDPLYRNLNFHRIKDFMVQTGDPTGTGTGDPGYVFEDEFHPDLSHSKPGILSMANRGPDTNGSQFFITKQPAEWLDGRHSVFGEVISGLDILPLITEGDTLEKIEISRVGDDAKSFDSKRAHEIAQAVLEQLRLAAKKTLPETMGPLDPVKVPDEGQPAVSPGDFQFIVIGHNEMMDHGKSSKAFYYDRKSALEFAQQLTRLARSKDADFDTLEKEYSDLDRKSLTRGIEDGPRMPKALKEIFHLAPGQISDPIDMPTGVYLFRRLHPSQTPRESG